jgi:Fic family protein
MRDYNYNKIYDKLLTSEIVSLLTKIHEFKGQQNLFIEAKSDVLTQLVEIAKIQSTEASNAIEGIVTTSTRIKQLVEERTTPRNRDEQEIAGYRDVLNIIHESFEAIPLSQNYILQLHKIMYSHMNNPMARRTKNNQNYITAKYPDGHIETIFTPLSPYETPEALNRICEEYNRVIGNMEVEPLIVIPIFIHDFLCIHPFNDGNGRMSRLLTTLLLYRSGFYVGKYISLEAKIAKNKDLYYSALNQSQDGWHEGCEDALPFIKYFLGIVLSAYRDFEDRFSIIEEKLPSIDIVRKATLNKIGKFTKQDIRELCPALSISSIESALRKMVASGELKREGSGKSTFYYRLK